MISPNTWMTSLLFWKGQGAKAQSLVSSGTAGARALRACRAVQRTKRCRWRSIGGVLMAYFMIQGAFTEKAWAAIGLAKP